MELHQIYNEIHQRIELKKKRRISHKEMAKDIGCSLDTYGGHLRGTNEPKSVKQFLFLLNMLDDDEVMKVVRSAKSDKGKE